MKLLQGRPADLTGRLPKEIRVYDFLDKLGISYAHVDHHAAMTMDECAEIDKVLDSTICKNLLLCNRQKTDFYLLMIAGHKTFKTSALSKQIGSSRLSFADGAYMEEFLDITPGSLSVLGLMNDKDMRIQLLIDEEILQSDTVGVHPCINTASLRLKTKDLLEVIIPAMGHPPRMVNLNYEE